MYSSLDSNGRMAIALVVTTFLSWLGEVVHNAIELPNLTILSLETSLPGLLAALLLLNYLLIDNGKTSAYLLFGWGVLNLTGGVLSLLPLNLPTYTPTQTPTHYAAHLLYALAQIPLMITSLKLAKR